LCARAPGLTAALLWTAVNLGPGLERVDAADEFPAEWYYPNRPAAHRAMEGKAAPVLSLGQWFGEPVDLRGKVAVIDFWATWCGPCRQAIPKNNQLLQKYADKGVVFVGVHDSSRGRERIPEIIEQYQIRYPIAVDQNRASERAWNVRFWPTYAVVDRQGIVRAVGLVPSSVEHVVERLVGEAATPSPAELTCEEGTSANRRRLEPLLAQESPPPLEATDWVNSEPLCLEDLGGKVVLLSFWTPARQACMRALQQAAELHRKYVDEGLVIVAIARARGRVPNEELVERLGLPFPVCVDSEFRTSRAYRVDNYPDFFLIDRAGRLRVADTGDECVEQVVASLLAEAPQPKRAQQTPPADAPAPQGG
jgi:thiol-disulfide isomerase/thioredoxin